jgi:succinyl-diaminopimelate desuccinylase
MSTTAKSDVLNILSDLISFKTVSGHTSEVNSCFDHVEAFLSDRTMEVVRHTSNGFASLVATPRGTKTPRVLLQAHLDVVPAKPSLFKLTEKTDKIYGRGVFDMKFAAACYLQLADELRSELAQYDFGIMFTSDEEIGGKNGVRYLLNQGYSADVCILPDGGNDWHIETTCNTVWIVRILANGQSAHGSRPWEGLNAINSLVEGLGEIQDVFGELKPYNNSITISKIQGGNAMNQVPDQAEAILDMRFIKDSEQAKYRTAIEKIVKSKQLQLETVAFVEARNVDITQPEVHSFLTIAEQVRGEPINKTHSFGASDACYFASHGIPTIVMRPTGGDAHSDQEWLDKTELFKFYELIKTYVTQTTKTS